MSVRGRGSRKCALFEPARVAYSGSARCSRMSAVRSAFSALRTQRLVLHQALEVADQVHVARRSTSGGGRDGDLPESPGLSCAATSATCRIQSVARTLSSMFLLEHEWSPAMAVSAAQSMQAGATPGCRRQSVRKALFVRRCAPRARGARTAPSAPGRAVRRQHCDVAMFGIDPRVGRDAQPTVRRALEIEATRRGRSPDDRTLRRAAGRVRPPERHGRRRTTCRARQGLLRRNAAPPP